MSSNMRCVFLCKFYTSVTTVVMLELLMLTSSFWKICSSWFGASSASDSLSTSSERMQDPFPCCLLNVLQTFFAQSSCSHVPRRDDDNLQSRHLKGFPFTFKTGEHCSVFVKHKSTSNVTTNNHEKAKVFLLASVLPRSIASCFGVPLCPAIANGSPKSQNSSSPCSGEASLLRISFETILVKPSSSRLI